MGRPRKFDRESVLEKVIPVFWARGYAETALQDLEKASGVNKSGLYSEFKDKEDIFLASLQHYYSAFKHETLSQKPLGWANITAFLKEINERCSPDRKGCFGINCMRELSVLPVQAHAIITRNRSELREFFLKNIQAESTRLPADAVADILSTFFSGLCIEKNLDIPKEASLQKIEAIIAVLRLS